MVDEGGRSKAQRKKARRKERRAAERTAGRDLDDMAEAAVTEALRLAPEVAAASNQPASERVIDVAVGTIDAARYARKRINEALAYGEWLNDVQVWVWEEGVHTRAPLSDSGRRFGVELRLEQPSRSSAV